MDLLYADDARIAWVRQRPYLVHDSLGSGAFGDVYRVQLLCPFGTRPCLDEGGNVVRRATTDLLKLSRGEEQGSPGATPPACESDVVINANKDVNCQWSSTPYSINLDDSSILVVPDYDKQSATVFRKNNKDRRGKGKDHQTAWADGSCKDGCHSPPSRSSSRRSSRLSP